MILTVKLLKTKVKKLFKLFKKALQHELLIKKLLEYYAKKEIVYFDNHLPNNPIKFITFDHSKSINEPDYLRNHISHIKIGDQNPYWIPVNSINNGDIVYSFGAEEEITFEVQLAKQFKANVFVFDPTPNSKKHFDLIMCNSKQGKKTFYFPKRFTDRFYDISKNDLDLITFNGVGISKNDTESKVYFTKDKKMFSLQQDHLFSELSVEKIPFKRLTTIMKEKGHKEIQLIKLDIEGEEYGVIDDMIRQNIRPKILLLEFHIPKLNRQFRKSVKQLVKYGYLLTFRRKSDFSFVEIEYYKHLYRLANY